MGNDDCFNKRKKLGIVERKKEHREQREALHIIYEGETEKSYLGFLYPNKFRHHKSNCLEHIKNKLKELSEAKHIFVFIDGDIQEEQNLKNFINQYKRDKKITIIINTPCIEYWFLLHFRFTTMPFIGNGQDISKADECIKAIKKEFENIGLTYKKGILQKSILEILKDKQETAIKHSKKFSSIKTKEFVLENPYSNMYDFFKDIQIFNT